MTVRANTSILVLLLVAWSGLAFAQTRGNQPGRNSDGSLQVQILTENRTTLDTQAFVRLRNIEDMDERWDTTRLGSQASINGLSRGRYTLEVNAVGFQTFTTTVEVRATVQLVQVVLHPEEKKTAYAAPDIKGISRKARQQCAKGIQALQSGNSKEAEKQFRKALKSAPENAHVNYLLGITLFRERRLPEAAAALERSVGLDPTHAQALTALAGLRLDAKDYAAAANLLERAVAANDRLWRPHLLLADVYLGQEQYDRARTHAELAVNLSNHSAPDAVLVLGQALSGLGRNAEAIAAFKEFMVESPSSPDAPAVRETVNSLEREVGRPTTPIQVSVMAPISFPVRTSPGVADVAPAWGPADVDSVTPSVASGVQCPADRVLTGITESVTDLIENLERFSALRTQVHQQLNLVGESLDRQTRKSKYLAAISHSASGLQLNEYTQDLSGQGAFSDGIRTRGMLGLALIFHPTLKDSYDLQCEGLGEWKGQPAWLVHFRQRPDRPLRLQSFRVGGQEISLALKGRAWVAASRFRILHIEADLIAPVAEVGLRSEHQVAEYGPVVSKKSRVELWLPKDTQTYLELRGRRYLFSDHFDDFSLFSVDTQHVVKAPKAAEVNSQ